MYSSFSIKWDFEQMGFCFQNQKQAKYFENGNSNKWDSWPPSGQAEQNGIVAVVICLILASHTHTRTVCLHPHISTQLSCFKHVHVMYQYECLPTNVFENLVAWGSRRGLKLWRGSKTAGDYSLQAQLFTNNFETLLFALQTSKFAWKWVVCVCVWRLHAGNMRLRFC